MCICTVWVEALLKCDTLYNAFDTFPGFRRAVNKIRKMLTVSCQTSFYIYVRQYGNEIIAIFFIPSLVPFLHFI